MADPVNAETVHLIMSCEGTVLHSYQDSGDVWTCCTGHTGPEAVPGRVFTQAECNQLLDADLTKFEDGVDGLLAPDADTSENEFGAMVSLAYNIGLGREDDPKRRGFRYSTVLREHNAGNKQAAADAFLEYDHAGGRVLEGLSRRRGEERTLYLKPDLSTPHPSVLVVAPPRDDRPRLIAWIGQLLAKL